MLGPIFEAEANARNAQAAVATPRKRRNANQPEDAPTPKRTRSALDNVDNQPASSMPRHIGGLLSAVVPDEAISQPASPSSGALPSPPADPEPLASLLPGKSKSKSLLNGIRDATPAAEESEAEEDDTMPAVPNGATEPDKHGVRLIQKRGRGNDTPNNRIMVPNLYEYEPHEIGFRDSTNDKSRGATKAKRRNLLNKPNSNAMFFDRIVGGYDATGYSDDELDQEMVKKYNLHPEHGFFLNSSINEADPARPFVDGHSPTVFITDDGKAIHTSRSVRVSKAEEPFKKMQLRGMMAAFMEEQGIDEKELHDPEIEKLIQERDARRAEREEQEHRAWVRQGQQVFDANIQALLDADAHLDASLQSEPVARRTRGRNQQESQSLSPVVSRPATMSRPYDAVRDSFGGSDLPPAASMTSLPVDNSASTGLSLLADVALNNYQNAETRPSRAAVTSEAQPNPTHPSTAHEMQQILIQMPEPVRPKQLRDPSELEQNEAMIVDYPDPDNEFVPRQLTFPAQYLARDPSYMLQPPQAFQEQRPGPQGQLAHPESFAYREAGPQLQASQHYAGQQSTQPYPYGDREASYEQQSQFRRQSQLSQPAEEPYAPAPPRPNVEDVALLDPQLFEDGQPPASSQLQAPQPEQAKPQSEKPAGVLQQPHTSFFQTALNSPDTPTAPSHPQALASYEDRPQTYQPPAPSMGSTSRPSQVTEGSPPRLPFSNPNGTEAQPLPALRPVHRASGPLMAPNSMNSQGPQHILMTPNVPLQETYPQPPSQGYSYPEPAYSVNGYGPDHPIMSTEQDSRAGYIAQPTMHSSQQPPPGYPAQPSFHPQAPSQYDNPQQGPLGQLVQSPPPYGHSSRTVSPSPGRRSSTSRNKQQQQQQQQPGYREIKPAPRQAETWEGNGGELRTLLYNPYEGIRDYHATAPPPSHGPTQIRGWTHNTQANRKSRGKNSTDSQVDPSLGRDEKK